MADTYRTVQGDTWDLISFALYGSEKYVGELMENNPSLLDYSIFPADVRLIVPEIQDDSDEEGFPDWRQVEEE